MIKEEFKELCHKWHKDTDGLSSVQKKLRHPAYLKIVAAGQQVVPFILEELINHGGHWFIALHTLTGANPIRRGNGTLLDHPTMDECIDSWARWGRENGLLS